MFIREIKEDDAKEFGSFLKIIDQETQFLLFEPFERDTDESTQRNKIRGMLKNQNQTILVVEFKGKIVGHIVIMGGLFQRNKYTANIVIGILQSFTGLGLGKKLMEKAEEWAIERNFHRLELTVMCHNHKAISLYKKIGFVIEGKRKHSLFLNEEFIDEFYMSKLLE